MVLFHTADNLNLFQWKFAYLSMASHLTQNKTEGPYYGLQALYAVTLTTAWPYLLLSSPVHSIPDNWPQLFLEPKYTGLRASVLVFPGAQSTFSRNAYGLLVYFLQHSAQKSSYVREIFQLPYIKQYHSHAHQSFSIPCPYHLTYCAFF